MSKKKYGKHEQTVDMLVDKLIKSEKFDKIVRDLDYSFPNANGQVDVLAFIGNKKYFYEVKSNYSRKSLKKAQEQYNRYKRFNETKNIEGYIVTMKKIERLDG